MERRTESIHIKVTEEEKKLLQNFAAADNRSLSDWCRIKIVELALNSPFSRSKRRNENE